MSWTIGSGIYIVIAVLLVAAVMLLISPRYDEGAFGHFALAGIIGSCAVFFFHLMNGVTYEFGMVTASLISFMALFVLTLALRDAIPRPRWRRDRRKGDRRSCNRQGGSHDGPSPQVP